MIRGKTVRFEGFDRIHLKRTLSWKNDPLIKRLTGTVYPISMEEHERWFDKVSQDDKFKIFAIKNEEGAHIGNVMLHNINWKDRSSEFGVYIDRNQEKRGYGKDALITLLNFAFNKLNLHRIYCHVFEFNKRAISLYRKLGFKVEGRLREALYLDGKYYDILVFSILDREFDNKNKIEC
ncbi:MAG: UDP-4-amino-4,6-dideoxy-N-acetyl-beta-L-altrosamine N-acetyltransferase [Candidatus Hodarchaeota archaeon]